MNKTPIVFVDCCTPLGSNGQRVATRVELYGKKKGRKASGETGQRAMTPDHPPKPRGKSVAFIGSA